MEFALLFDTPNAAERAAETLRAESFGVDLQPQADGSMVVVAWPTDKATDGVDLTLARMREVAQQFGGHFLGHGRMSSIGLQDEDHESDVQVTFLNTGASQDPR